MQIPRYILLVELWRVFCYLLLFMFFLWNTYTRDFPSGSVVKNPPANAGDSEETGSIPGLGRSPAGGNGNLGKESACNAGDLGSILRLGRSPGEGKGYPLQYSGLENSMDCIVHGVAKSRHNWATFTFQYSFLENPMDSGTWQATGHRVTKSQMWLSNWAAHIQRMEWNM